MRPSLRAVGALAAAAAVIALAGCADADAAGSTDDTPAESLSAQAQAAQGVVDQFLEPVDTFDAPGDPVDASSLAGSTVYFVPMTLQVPVLNTIAESVQAALAEVDVTVQICDAKLNPADLASCVGQAVSGDAAAVVTAGIPQEFAPAAFQSLADAGIPWVNGITTPAGEGDPTQVGYVTADNVVLQSIATNWVIADSNAAANVLVLKLTDSEATTLWADYGILGVYEQGCADCTVEVVETNSGQLDKLPSLVSSALVANPDITHIQAQFDQLLPAVTQGLQAAARVDVRVASVDGLLSSLQDISAGGPLKADAGYDLDALGWYIADAVVRLGTGNAAVQNLEFPFRRLFTADNVGELTLSADAEASGEWFGAADYRAGFLELWGAQ